MWTVPAKAEIIHHGIPQSKLVYIPQAVHTSSVENPNAVNRTIVDFLTQQ